MLTPDALVQDDAYAATPPPRCQWYHRHSTSVCADACLPERVGPCPVVVPVVFGRLSPGNCIDAGFSVPQGVLDIMAGPCGAI
jgi:hypothetical protein